MEILSFSPQDYEKQLGGLDLPVFMRKDFLELNKDKVDEILYLVGKDSKPRFAIVVGVLGKEWKAPFSAPFADIINIQKSMSVEKYWDFIQSFNIYAKKQGAQSIELYLPADCYDRFANTLALNALLGNGYKIKYLDINYSLNLDTIVLDSYQNGIQRNARKNLRIALNSYLDLVLCTTKAQKIEAYETIRINRESRGFPLRMTCEQLMSTIEIVDHNFFLVIHEGETVAAAVVYNINEESAQVVYWGEKPNHSELKSINFISYKLIEFYKQKNFKLLDIGISTEYGVPNYGLCSFKESIGCEVSNKYRLRIDL